MTYTSPATFTAGQLITANDLNTQLRDNVIALKDPPSVLYNVNQGADYTTTSTTFANVDATNLALALTLDVDSDVMIWFNCVLLTAANRGYLDVTMDGVQLAGDSGIIATASLSTQVPLSFVFWKESVAAGSHTFSLVWKTNTGTLTMYAGAGTANYDLHPQFGVRVVS